MVPGGPLETPEAHSFSPRPRPLFHTRQFLKFVLYLLPNLSTIGLQVPTTFFLNHSVAVHMHPTELLELGEAPAPGAGGVE